MAGQRLPVPPRLGVRALGELDHAEERHHHARATFREALRLFYKLDMPAEETATLRMLEAVGEPA